MSSPDHALLLAVAADPGTPRRLDTLPIFVDLGAELIAFDPGSGTLKMAFAPGERHLQGAGVIAGGVIGTMLDFAMSLPVLGVLPAATGFATASFTVNLLAPLRPGRVLAHGRIVRRGSRAAFTAAELADESGRQLATGSSTVLILPAAPQERPHG